jgi:glycosyltransferase 2 family protein
MSKTIQSALKYLLFLAIGGGLMYWAYEDVDWSAIQASLSNAHWGYALLALLLNYSATVYRGLRWNTLLQPLGYKADRWTCAHSVAFGYLMNDLIPRSGEVARCTLLNRAEGVPVDKLIGTVILERIVDVVMLLICVLIALVIKNEELLHLFSFVDGNKAKLILVLLAAGIVGIIAVVRYIKYFRRFKLVAMVEQFLQGIGNGLRSVFMMRDKWPFIGWTLAIWGTWVVMSQAMMWTLSETSHLQLDDALFLMVAASFGMLIPTQGGLGSYHYMSMLGFVALGFANADDPMKSDIGLMFAIVSWSGKTVLELVMGAVGFFVVTRFKIKKDQIKTATE